MKTLNVKTALVGNDGSWELPSQAERELREIAANAHKDGHIYKEERERMDEAARKFDKEKLLKKSSSFEDVVTEVSLASKLKNIRQADKIILNRWLAASVSSSRAKGLDDSAAFSQCPQANVATLRTHVTACGEDMGEVQIAAGMVAEQEQGTGLARIETTDEDTEEHRPPTPEINLDQIAYLSCMYSAKLNPNHSPAHLHSPTTAAPRIYLSAALKGTREMELGSEEAGGVGWEGNNGKRGGADGEEK